MCRKLIDGLLDGRLDLFRIGRQCHNHLRRALGHLERLPVHRFHGGFGAFMHRVEWLEMDHLITLQRLFAFHASQYGQVDSVLIVRARRQRSIEDDVIGRDAVHAERIAQCQLVLGQSAGFV